MLRCLRFVVVMLVFGSSLAFGLEQVVEEIRVEGNKRVDQTAIRAVIASKPGAPLTQDDIDRDLQAIFRLARFNDVRARIDTIDGKQVLIYHVVERPLVRSVKFDGNKEYSEEKLKSMLTQRIPDIYDPVALQKSIVALRKFYEEEGFYAATIEPQIELNDNNEAIVTLKIVEGAEIRIDTIRFTGQSVIPEKSLKKAMETKERWFLSWMTGRGSYQRDVLQNDLEILADLYFNLGYIQVKVHQPEVTLLENNRFLDVLIEIEEGEQFRVGELGVKGDLIEDRAVLLELLGLREGDVFSRKALREGLMKINDLYSDKGYAYVNVAPLSQIDVEERRVNLTIEIEQNQLVTIHRIDVSGNEKTFDKVVRREMQVVEGERYNAAKVKESRRLIQNLGFFEEVKLATEKGATPEQMDIKVEVKERSTGTFSLGFGYSTVDGVIGQTSVSQDNLWGRGIKGSLSAALGSKSTTYSFGLLDPRFLDSNISLGFDLYKTDREWDDFSKRATGGDLKFGFPVTEKTRAFFIYRYEEKEIYDVDADASATIRDQEGFSTLSSVYGSLTRDTTDYRLDPTIGTISTGSVEVAGLGGTERFVKYELDGRYFHPLFWKTVFSLHGKIGYVQQLAGEEIPIDERYYLGGLSSIRGFNPRTVGPRELTYKTTTDADTGETTTSAEYEYTGGNKAAYSNVELTFPLIPDTGIKGVVFYDIGNAWGEEEEYFTSLRQSVGFGIRWFSPLGPLRLEWGYNLSPKPDEASSDLQFTIGTMF